MSWQIVGDSFSQIFSTLLLILAGVAVLEVIVYLIFGVILKSQKTIVAMLLAPAILGLGALVVYPLLYELRLAFSNMNLYHFRDPEFSFGIMLGNFARVFTQPVLKKTYFFPLLGRTFLWTSIQVFFHVSLGMLIAIILNRPLRFKNVYKALIILPWAMPAVIACLTWRSEFHFEYGFFNVILTTFFGPEAAIPWKSNGFWNFTAMNMTNIWLGVPFMMVISLGGLQSISHEYYEAAEMDGASGWLKFSRITLPLMKPILTPSIMLGVIWTFNNFNVPFFINEQELESSDILVTGLFRAAFQYNQYGFSAAFAIVIFLILFGFSIFYIKQTGALKGVRD